MATSLWLRSGDTQTKKSIFAAAFGANVSFFVGGTTTPLVVFEDSGENNPVAAGNVVTVDGSARWPNTFVPTGNPYNYRILDVDGTIITSADNVPNPDPSTAAPPPAAAYETGDTVWRPQDGTRDTWVRMAGRTIGSFASGASERANDDAFDLYEFLWNNCGQDQCPVTGGRGASANADFFAGNKPLQLLDMRGGGPIGLDTMGNTDLLSLANTPFANGDATTVGSAAGAASTLITEAQLPAHVHDTGTYDIVADLHSHGVGTLANTTIGDHQHISGQTGNDNADHTHPFTAVQSGDTASVQSPGGISVIQALNSTVTSTATESASHQHTFDTPQATVTTPTITGLTGDDSHTHDFNGASGSIGSGDPFNLTQRAVLGTWYQKL